ncbi:hypothetical protein FQA39_LY05107 [Lamprigera yunnana]|nr:hypothetical protein FQA39_LY05107 [Lamprigera yunnana]
MSKIWKPVRHLFLNSVLNKTSQTLTYIYIHSKPDRVYKKRIPTYQSTSVIYKSGKKYAIARIQELFKLSRTEAVEIAERYKKLCKTPSNAIVNNYELLKNFEIPDGVILKYMDVLALTNLQGKVEALKKLPFPLTDTLPLLQMHNNRLTHFIKENQHESNVTRIKRLCELLEISVSELSEVFVKRSFLCKINLDKVEKNLKTLLEYGIKLEQIRNDYWVLQYKHDVITERLQFANQQNIDTIKTWMVRAQPKILNRFVFYYIYNHDLLLPVSVRFY